MPSSAIPAGVLSGAIRATAERVNRSVLSDVAVAPSTLSACNWLFLLTAASRPRSQEHDPLRYYSGHLFGTSADRRTGAIAPETKFLAEKARRMDDPRRRDDRNWCACTCNRIAIPMSSHWPRRRSLLSRRHGLRLARCRRHRSGQSRGNCPAPVDAFATWPDRCAARKRVVAAGAERSPRRDRGRLSLRPRRQTGSSGAGSFARGPHSDRAISLSLLEERAGARMEAAGRPGAQHGAAFRPAELPQDRELHADVGDDHDSSFRRSAYTGAAARTLDRKR